ncbi:STAS domain-containing protein [Chondromyces apiculatus]|uniref:RsbR, positive regulator of sigma-B n=1 Tax=Chondromyces apiculatus DSM 436 TaxID=1192034 RepID=A0A017SWQ3_9BACT|nr:STAS domain-containing protein [Chondromyces apiculatus]EYF01394.1 RsbR, positive regulator of sigma-B [Chondromyces apiculatus DSM 436]
MMANEAPGGGGSVEGSLTSRLSAEELEMVRSIGTGLLRVLQGRYDDIAQIARRDELGILANMVERVAKSLKAAKEKENTHRQVLEEKIRELEDARAQQEDLLALIRQLSCPVLYVERGVLLVPLIGDVDAARAELVTTALLGRAAEMGADTVILDVTGVPRLHGQVAHVIERAAQAARLLGARAIVCGLSPESAREAVAQGLDFAGLTPCSTLASALEMARSWRHVRHARPGEAPVSQAVPSSRR